MGKKETGMKKQYWCLQVDTAAGSWDSTSRTGSPGSEESDIRKWGDFIGGEKQCQCWAEGRQD